MEKQEAVVSVSNPKEQWVAPDVQEVDITEATRAAVGATNDGTLLS